MAPHATIDEFSHDPASYQTPEVATESAKEQVLEQPPTDYSYTYDNRDGTTPEQLDPSVPYRVAEHILWAPRKVRVASIGAGASGIMMCYKKEKEFGDEIDLVVYERYDQCGGVWHANRYPGCRCDVPSAGYQLSFAPSAEWPRYYSSANDIKEYYHGFARDKGYIDKYIHLSHEVQKATWSEADGQWKLDIVQTFPDGRRINKTDNVDFLVGNIGVLNTWKWPDVPNREAFRGQITHSAAYDTSIDLTDKRVAVIGSGASSIQIIPAIQKQVKSLTCFYRTPQWVTTGLAVEGYTDPSGRNFTHTEEQKERYRSDPEYYLKYRKAMENKINGSFRHNLKDHVWHRMGHEAVKIHMMTTLKNDPKLISRLVPDFAMGCRRLGPAEGFLEAMSEPNVTLADGNIKEFTPRGVLTDLGVEHEFDVIICATGFDVSFRPYFPIIGREGVSLSAHWKSEPEAYLALAATGFPNFMLGSLGPNCPAGHGSFVTVLEAAQNYICKIIRKLQTENIKTIDVKEDAVKAYNEHVHEWLKRTVWSTGCRSWYNQGRPDGKLTAQYPGSLVHWRKMLDHPRYEDYNLTYRSLNRFQFMGNGFTREEVAGEDLSWYLDADFVAKPLFDH